MNEESLDEIARRLCPHMPIDPGIIRAVAVLDAADVETFESCQGGDGHCFAEPTVRWHGGPGAGWQGLGVLLTFGLPVRRLSRSWSFDNHAAGEGPNGPYWEATFYQRLNEDDA